MKPVTKTVRALSYKRRSPVDIAMSIQWRYVSPWVREEVHISLGRITGDTGDALFCEDAGWSTISVAISR